MVRPTNKLECSRVAKVTTSERRITRLIGLILGGIFVFGLVLNAFAF